MRPRKAEPARSWPDLVTPDSQGCVPTSCAANSRFQKPASGALSPASRQAPDSDARSQSAAGSLTSHVLDPRFVIEVDDESHYWKDETERTTFLGIEKILHSEIRQCCDRTPNLTRRSTRFRLGSRHFDTKGDPRGRRVERSSASDAPPPLPPPQRGGGTAVPEEASV